MTIKAVLHNGNIQPLEPIPSDWVEGQELLIEQPSGADAESQVKQWAEELAAGVARIPEEEHSRFLRALEENERESKDAIRREWGQK